MKKVLAASMLTLMTSGAFAQEPAQTLPETGAMLSHLAFYAGWPKVFSAMPVAKEVFESRAE